MPSIDQLQTQVDRLRQQKESKQKDIDKHNVEIQKIQKIKDDIQNKIDKLTGNMEEDGDAAITTTTAGNISVPGGKGNYAPKMGMKSRNGFTKKSMFKKKYKYESKVFDYLDTIFEEK